MAAQHQPGEIIDNRYRILHFLGQGGIGTTYAAEHLETGEKVALKAVSLCQVDDFKVLELFEREARILAQLDHRAIPCYVDSFQAGKRRSRVFYLVQQLAEGLSLAKLVEMRWHPDEAKVRQIAERVLEILVYLQQLTPPVIHRDIKPENIIYRADGELFLVDFGAVQDVYHHTLTGGSTVAGTYGYMAPEQFRGKTVLATDLYGLGATLIFLLTRKPPTELPQRKLKIYFRSHVRIEKRFCNWIDRLIEPVADDRFLCAEEALAVLQGKPEFDRQTSTPQTRRPTNSPITLINDRDRLLVEIPPIWLRSPHSRLFALFPAIIDGFLLLMLWITAISSYVLTPVGSIYISIYGLFGLGLFVQFLHSSIFRLVFKTDVNEFALQRYFFRWCYQTVQGRTKEIIEIELQPIGLSMNKDPITVCTLRCRLRQYRFGCFLTEMEKEWLVAEVREFLANSRESIVKK
ncbi:serine/threonine protein kinase [Oscillatoriales cyanobacterium LEGE 11467]|uniref:non-specific serine/threonine protein kinase n=2 Tax=Zarconia TaxID=2992130 RepID=A0A928VY89_9CYAN|nr:serine/threonine protein kinase [Zarconia navalis LEGE 11467]